MSTPQGGLACKALIIFPVTTTYSSFFPFPHQHANPCPKNRHFRSGNQLTLGPVTHPAYGAYGAYSSFYSCFVSPVQTIKQWSVRWSSFCSLLLILLLLLRTPPCCQSCRHSNPVPIVLWYPLLSVEAGWLAGLDRTGSTRLDSTEWDGDRVSYFHHPPHFPSGSSIASFAQRLCLCLCCCGCTLFQSLLTSWITPSPQTTLTNYSLLVLFGLWVSFRKDPERPSLVVPTRQRLVVALVLANG